MAKFNIDNFYKEIFPYLVSLKYKIDPNYCEFQLFTDGDYSGNIFLIANPCGNDDEFYLLIQAYGSCSVCDALQAALDGGYQQFLNLIHQMYGNLKAFGSKSALIDYFNNPPELAPWSIDVPQELNEWLTISNIEDSSTLIAPPTKDKIALVDYPAILEWSSYGVPNEAYPSWRTSSKLPILYEISPILDSPLSSPPYTLFCWYIDENKNGEYIKLFYSSEEAKIAAQEHYTLYLENKKENNHA